VRDRAPLDTAGGLERFCDAVDELLELMAEEAAHQEQLQFGDEGGERVAARVVHVEFIGRSGFVEDTMVHGGRSRALTGACACVAPGCTWRCALAYAATLASTELAEWAAAAVQNTSTQAWSTFTTARATGRTA
jgi:hypothetical protein